MTEATKSQSLNFYLAQKLCFWTGIIIGAILSVCVPVSVYLDYLKKFLTDFTKKNGRMFDNDKKTGFFKR